MSIASRIRQARKEKGLTQEQLAKIIGVTKGAVANYENQVSVPKTDVMYKLFEALNVDANFIYQDDMISNLNNKKDSEHEPTVSPLMCKYNKLNDIGKQKVDDYVEDLSTNPKYSAKLSKSKSKAADKSSILHFKKDSNVPSSDGSIINNNYIYSQPLALQQEPENERLYKLIEQEKAKKEEYRNTVINENAETLKRLLDAEVRVRHEQNDRLSVIEKEYDEAQAQNSNSDETYNLKLRVLIEKEKIASSDLKMEVLNEELKKR